MPGQDSPLGVRFIRAQGAKPQAPTGMCTQAAETILEPAPQVPDASRVYPRWLLLLWRHHWLQRKRRHRATEGRARLLTVPSSTQGVREPTDGPAPAVEGRRQAGSRESCVYSRQALLAVSPCDKGWPEEDLAGLLELPCDGAPAREGHGRGRQQCPQWAGARLHRAASQEPHGQRGREQRRAGAGRPGAGRGRARGDKDRRQERSVALGTRQRAASADPARRPCGEPHYFDVGSLPGASPQAAEENEEEKQEEERRRGHSAGGGGGVGVGASGVRSGKGAARRQPAPAPTIRAHYFDDATAEAEAEAASGSTAGARPASAGSAGGSAASSAPPYRLLAHPPGAAERRPAGLEGLAVPVFVGLNLQHQQAFFWQAACAFAARLAADFGLGLQVPEPAVPAAPEAASGQADSWKARPMGAWAPAASGPPAGTASALATPSAFRWPRALHMTAFFLGGNSMAASLPQGARRALELEGSRWQVLPTHIVYAEDALLVAALEVVTGGFPQEPGCLPHVTLLCRRPFSPSHARQALEAAAAAGLLGQRPPPQVAMGASELQLLPRAPLGGSSLDVYAWRLPEPAPRHSPTVGGAASSAEGLGAAAGGFRSALLEARLESFWEHRLFS